MLVKEGVEVVVPGGNINKVNQAIASLGGKVWAFKADLATAEDTANLIREVPETDILGIYESKQVGDITDEEWFRYFEVNLLGVIRLSRHYLLKMVAQDWGRIAFCLE